MEIFVEIDSDGRSQLESTAGTIVMIPFSGTVKGEIFNGKILAGSVDTQVIDVNGVKHMSARYMLEGEDHVGKNCRIFVENDAHFHKDTPKPFHTIPTFYTDSKILAPYLHARKFRGEGHSGEHGLVIKFFESSIEA